MLRTVVSILLALAIVGGSAVSPPHGSFVPSSFYEALAIPNGGGLLGGLFATASGLAQGKLKEVSPEAGDVAELLKTQAKALTPECQSVVQECMNMASAGNCKEDIKDCLSEAVTGPLPDPTYTNLGSAIDVAGIFESMSRELSLPSPSWFGKKLLKRCKSGETSIFTSALQSIGIAKPKETVPEIPQVDFVCRIVTHKDVGTFNDLTSAPPPCSWQTARDTCDKEYVRPTIPDTFKKFYPIIEAAATASSAATTSVDARASSAAAARSDVRTLRDCWQRGDRALCAAAVILGKVCDASCPIALCTFERLRHDQQCEAKLTAQDAAFFKAADSMCRNLAKALSVKVSPCQSPIIHAVKKKEVPKVKAAAAAGPPQFVGGLALTLVAGVLSALTSAYALQ